MQQRPEVAHKPEASVMRPLQRWPPPTAISLGGPGEEARTFWIMMVKGPSIWKPRAKYMTLHQPSTSARDMGTTSPLVLVSRIAMVTSTREA